MKKTSNNQSFFFASSKKSSRRGPVLFGVFALLLVTGMLLWRSALEGLLLRAAMPLLSFRESTSASEVAALRQELASTTAALADRDLLYKENTDLKAAMGRTETLHTLLAGVVMRPPQTPYDTAIIDIGSDAGLREGSTVYASGNTVVGVISQTYLHSARVTFFSSPGETYDALLIERAAGNTTSSKPIQLQGAGLGSFTAQVPAGTAVAIGDSIVLPGIHSSFIGDVSRVESPPGASFTVLYAHLPVNPLELRFVYVTLSSQ